MKKLSIMVALIGGLTSLQCMALTVNVGRLPGYFTIPGGEFDVTSVSADPAFTSLTSHYVAGVTAIGGGFETFCIQLDTELGDNPQTATLSPAVVSGTAFLYSMFAGGTLAGYQYSATSVVNAFGFTGRDLSALALQMAIWELQGYSITDINNHVVNNVDATDLANAWLQAAAYVTSAAGASGTYNVDALVLVGANGQPAQNMLVKVPDGGTTVMLLGFAMGGIGLISRKLRRN